MNFEYDSEVDGLYIWFVEDIEKEKGNFAQEFWPKELNGEIGLLFDKNGKLMGLEIQPASKYMYSKFLKDGSQKEY